MVTRSGEHLLKVRLLRTIIVHRDIQIDPGLVHQICIKPLDRSSPPSGSFNPQLTIPLDPSDLNIEIEAESAGWE
ncbi:hypothetical protein NLI96_g10154 [Meripilus lineatus]|uniref:Uncharacterized protein n=1 Tax=Meripilus lineatus TaxID=2056292 RepID=A0AAD5YAC4_9APHY|nr:hypothetical protein NLI96_g10154 [Physisporinus lineatus]